MPDRPYKYINKYNPSMFRKTYLLLANLIATRGSHKIVQRVGNMNDRILELQKLNSLYPHTIYLAALETTMLLILLLLPTVWPKCVAVACTFNHSPIKLNGGMSSYRLPVPE